MAKTPEATVKDAVKKYLTAIGAYWYMPVSNGMGRVGCPDFLICYKGRFIACETKAPGRRGNTTPNQDREIEWIQRADGVALVVDDVEQLKEVLEDAAQRPRSQGSVPRSQQGARSRQGARVA